MTKDLYIHTHITARRHTHIYIYIYIYTQREGVAEREAGREKGFQFISSGHNHTIYEGWNFNSGNYLFTTDTK